MTTFVSHHFDESGNYVGFNRWNYKRASSVKRAYEKLAKDSLWRAVSEEVATVSVFATPDGYHREQNPVMTFPLPV